MTAIESLIQRNKANFEVWQRQFNEYLLLQYEPDSIETAEERDRIFFQTNELLISIAENFFIYGQFKDKWDTSKGSIMPGQYILLRSEKMDLTFNWGVDHDVFYLESYLMHWENLRFMNDDFWSALLELKSNGEFEYAGGGGLDSVQKPYFENKTSTIFQLIRTFMLNQAQAMTNGKTQWEFGTLVLKWEMNYDWPSLLEKTCRAFRLAYALNYQLWKVSDLAAKKTDRRV